MLRARAESLSPEARRPVRATTEERDLVRRMRAGDESAFDSFADHYIPALSRFAASRLHGDRDLIREVVQMTVCKIIEKLDSYRGEAPLFTWLCACCRNEIAAHYRRQTRAAASNTDDDAALAVAAASNPEDLLLESESIDLVHLALDHLPPRYAAALEWKYMEAMSVNEIAQRLQLSPKAAESLLSRARAQFRSIHERLSSGGRRRQVPVEVMT